MPMITDMVVYNSAYNTVVHNSAYDYRYGGAQQCLMITYTVVHNSAYDYRYGGAQQCL